MRRIGRGVVSIGLAVITAMAFFLAGLNLTVGPTISGSSFEATGGEVAFAWSKPICNPKTGEVKQPGDFPNEKAYFQYLKDHLGSFEMNPGDTCKPPPQPTPVPPTVVPVSPTTVPVPSPVPPTSVPPVATAVPTSVPTPVEPTEVVPLPSGPPPGASWLRFCHWEPTQGWIHDSISASAGGVNELPRVANRDQSSPLSDYQLAKGEECQDLATSVPTATTVPPTATLVPPIATATPSPTPIVVPPTATTAATVEPTMSPTPTAVPPTATPGVPVMRTPVALPPTGDGSTYGTPDNPSVDQSTDP